jgi:hypothetical protein
MGILNLAHARCLSIDPSSPKDTIGSYIAGLYAHNCSFSLSVFMTFMKFLVKLHSIASIFMTSRIVEFTGELASPCATFCWPLLDPLLHILKTNPS